MSTTTLALYFATLIAFGGCALGGLFLVRRRLGFWGRTGLFFVFYVIVRYSLRCVPSGLVPYVADEPLFYGLFMVCCLVACWFYVRRIEGMSWAEVGWSGGRLGVSILWGVVALVIGVGLLLPLSSIETSSLRLTPGMFVVAATFGLALGGFFEETVFRGVIQTRMVARMTVPRAIALQAAMFSAGHIFYFPFDEHAFFYLGTFMIGLVGGVLRHKVSLLSAVILHGGLVVCTVLAPDWMFGFLGL